jgi:hypothetical protein
VEQGWHRRLRVRCSKEPAPLEAPVRLLLAGLGRSKVPPAFPRSNAAAAHRAAQPEKESDVEHENYGQPPVGGAGSRPHARCPHAAAGMRASACSGKESLDTAPIYRRVRVINGFCIFFSAKRTSRLLACGFMIQNTDIGEYLCTHTAANGS